MKNKKERKRGQRMERGRGERKVHLSKALRWQRPRLRQEKFS